MSQNGFDVTVYEKNEKENMGHDWEDCIGRSILNEIGLNVDEFNLKPFDNICYCTPDKTVLIKTSKKGVSNLAYIDRKELIKKLISHCEECGVRFVFGADIKNAIIKDKKVTGILYTKDGEEFSATGEMVIDGCGINSPVRNSLPAYTGIVNKIPERDTFNVYRAYYEKKDFPSNYPKYTVYLFHKGNPGLDWVINGDDFVDVLIGSFGKMKENSVENALSDFRKCYKCLGEKVIRGGTTEQIPVRKPLPIFTFDGYAAVGDSASMVEPLSGSGINLALKSGYELGEFILSSEKYNTKEALYSFQRDFLLNNAPRLINDDIIKHLLTDLGENTLNEMFRKKVIGIKELGGGKLNAKDIFDKIKGVITTPSSLSALIIAGKRLATLKSLLNSMPLEYSEAELLSWANKYENF